MTKSELIEEIADALKFTTFKAETVINVIFDSMSKSLKQGSGIEIRGFGSFSVREYKSYTGRNPRTGETVSVAPKRLPFFKVGKDLRERVNDSYVRSLSKEDAAPEIPAEPSPVVVESPNNYNP